MKGRIAEAFTRDLLLDPKDRDVNDIVHSIAAVASSTSQEKATAFVAKLAIPAPVKCLGSYEELYECKEVDIIYVATPQAFHYENVLDSLNAGKHVLCEVCIAILSKFSIKYFHRNHVQSHTSPTPPVANTKQFLQSPSMQSKQSILSKWLIPRNCFLWKQLGLDFFPLLSLCRRYFTRIKLSALFVGLLRIVPSKLKEILNHVFGEQI